MTKKILFLVPYPLGESPSQRFRFEQYFGVLREHGFQFAVQSFLNTGNWQLFFNGENIFFKLYALMTGFAKRLIIPFHALSFDYVFIHREVTPIGPPVMEWFLAKILRRRIIYDFDDAIWLTDRTNESALLKILKWRSKVRAVCSWSYKVSCGNEYLLNYASAFNKNVKYIPATIETDNWHNPSRFPKSKDSKHLVVGWTGSHSTLKYLKSIEPVLQQLEARYAHVRFVFIADQKPPLALKSLQFIPWNKHTEVQDLMSFDIGIMPLPDDEWAKGKCGFKALQYMALGIPTVVSPVGVNTRIVEAGENGLLARTSEEWFNALSSLIENEKVRKEMGIAGRKKIIAHYSVNSVSSSFLSLFE
jgi:glycosyltransferase involved in cell wall biosynthesis